MRNDSLAHFFDQRRWQSSGQVSSLPAHELWQRDVKQFRFSGATVADEYGLLAHYTTVSGLGLIRDDGFIGGKNGGCWLTPTPYAACIAPYDLGLDTPRNLCLLVDVSKLQELWGPGTSEESRWNPAVWQGGAIEFYSAAPVPYEYVKHVIPLAPCGDLHR